MATDENKLLSCLGLCQRAGKTVCGVPMICDAMRRGGQGAPVCVLEAADTSEGTHKKLTDKCNYYKTLHIRLSVSGDALAYALGKTSFLGAVAVTDRAMSEMVQKHL